MTLLSVLAMLSGIVSGFANIPQAYKIFKRKSAKDIAISTYLMILVGTLIWTMYGFEIKDMAVIVTNGFGVLSVGLVVIGWIFYGREKKKRK